MTPLDSSHPILRKLENNIELTDAERDAVRHLPMQVVEISADQDIVREGDRPTRSCALLEGVTCTFKITGEGKRQIVAFHIPGDIPDVQSLHLNVLDTSLGTITPCTVGFIQHEALRALFREQPRIGDAFWRETLIDASIFREWMLNVGQRNAYRRLAHILCEFLVRLRAVGLAKDHSCDLPITQSELGDATGLSNVHVNRSLKALRNDGLITFRKGTLQVLDWPGLKAAGDFDLTYLHLSDRISIHDRDAFVSPATASVS